MEEALAERSELRQRRDGTRQHDAVAGERRFTYADTQARVRRLAAALARLGVGRGTRVAALDTNSHRYVEAYYATAMLGGVFIPLNYRAKRPELEHMLGKGDAQWRKYLFY